ncbi:hypothetical protein [Pseudomonas sp. NBRC 111121]|uniref:hypothetical protein n=1 Tax=Pseudomonas sp. NBRC 111121 TaxID=1661036 RepID=UPI000A8154E1|nr:hypothetical protein [Pseudomonas sp. NBRC 111121]
MKGLKLATLAAALLPTFAFAGYTVVIPLEVPSTNGTQITGGSLPENSINFINPNSGNGNGGNGGSTEPTEPTEPSTARKLVSVTYIVGLVNSDGLTSGYNNSNPSFSQMYNSMVAVTPYVDGSNEVVEMRSGSYKCPVSGNFEMEAGKTIAFQCAGNLIPSNTALGESFTIDFWTK